jgi:GGDEF domain-containing protein
LITAEGVLVALKRELARSLKNGSPMAVVLVQASAAEATKGRQGQTVSEAVLSRIAGVIGEAVAVGHVAGHYRRNAFLVVLPGHNRNKASAFCETLLAGIRSETMSMGEEPTPRIDFGVTVVFQMPGLGVETVISAAEAALGSLRNKERGGVAFAPISAGPVAAVEPAKGPAPAKAGRLDLELIVAARGGNVKRVRGLLDSGAYVDARDNRGNTPLIEAAFFKYPELVQLLLDRGADADARNQNGDSALSEAVRAGHGAIVKTLLLKSSRPKLKEDLQPLYRALVEASTYGHTEVVSMVKRFFAQAKTNH